MDWLRHHTTEPDSTPTQAQHTSALSPQTANTIAHYAARTRDPNAPENKYQVNQQCIYERRLPGGSYITAHLQRLQSGFYDSPVIHEDLIDNVRFVALNFVFHPSRSHFRFKYAEIRLALHDNARYGKANGPSQGSQGGQAQDRSRHEHATQTSPTYVDGPDGSVIRYVAAHHRSPKPVRPKFLRHAPHLMYGAVSPETLDWNFNVAGSVGVAQGPATASLTPSGGMKGSYKLYDMMKIQGSVRTLRSWYGRQYDIEDGEIVWTLEENKLQQSGLPREFTFVVLLTKGTSALDISDPNALTLDVDIDAKVAGFVGKAAFPDLVTNMRRYRPFRYPPVDLDLEVGQVFEPSEKGRGFNFARLSSQFDDYVSSHKRTLTITSAKQQPRFASGSSAAPQSRSRPDSQRASSGHERAADTHHSLRKARSRSELNSEYNSSPIQEKATLANLNSEAKSSADDLPYSLLPVDHLQDYRNVSSTKDSQHQAATHEDPLLPQPVPEHTDQGNPRTVDSRHDHYLPEAATQATAGQEDQFLPQPDSETLPQHEFHKPFKRPVADVGPYSETAPGLHPAAEHERHILDPASPRLTQYSTTDGTGEWGTPPERTSATFRSSTPLSPGPTLTMFSQTRSSLYYEQPRALSVHEQDDDGAVADDEGEHHFSGAVPPRGASYMHVPIRRKPLFYHGEVVELPTNDSGNDRGIQVGNNTGIQAGNNTGIQAGNVKGSEGDNSNNRFASRLQRQQNRDSADSDRQERQHERSNGDLE
ncbi:hypothetical protein DV735_g3439, partial [Chaetothyriales sp. CBS 134920]